MGTIRCVWAEVDMGVEKGKQSHHPPKQRTPERHAEVKDKAELSWGAHWTGPCVGAQYRARIQDSPASRCRIHRQEWTHEKSDEGKTRDLRKELLMGIWRQDGGEKLRQKDYPQFRSIPGYRVKEGERQRVDAWRTSPGNWEMPSWRMQEAWRKDGCKTDTKQKTSREWGCGSYCWSLLVIR